MNIPLDEFEQHIDEDILKRGLLYFKKGYVTSVDELSGGDYEAIVEGIEGSQARGMYKEWLLYNVLFCAAISLRRVRDKSLH